MLFDFPFDDFFDSLVVQKCVVLYLRVCEFSSFHPVTDFYFTLLWWEKILNMISVFLNLLRLVL